ncbi:MAG: hypothetical protein LBP22_07445 [Deltaproteobacteria bacterium]|jgi:hypothetical protein|nr:hypothetical protein [Deltaproteobacteria bacterium]
MAKPFIFTAEELTKAKIFRDSPSNGREHMAGLLFFMMSHGRYTAEELADLYGIGAGTVYGDIKIVRTPELAASKGEWSGGRNRLMTF